MRQKDAEELISKMFEGDEIVSLGNGKIPNVMGVGQLVITRLENAEGEEQYHYGITDTTFEYGMWVAKGGSRGGIITKKEAIEYLAEYGRSRSKIKFYTEGEIQ